MRITKEKNMKKKLKQQETWKKRRERNKKIAIQERKCFICESFGHITWYYRNKREIEKNRRAEVRELEYQLLSNKFKVLTSRIM